MKKEERGVAIVFGLLGLLQLTLIGCQLLGIIQWSWLWIFSPIWIPVFLFIAIICICLVVVGISDIFKKS